MWRLGWDSIFRAVRRLHILQDDRRQSFFAEITGNIPQNISRYLKDRLPSLEFLVQVSHMMNVSLDWLILGEGPMHSSDVDWSNVTFEQIGVEYQKRLQDICATVEHLKEVVKGPIENGTNKTG